jgi:bifunctional DNA-binding transcriptional regulator/antitoxin component of YhaV-PrlF toxin-antitoxin module
MALQRQPWQNNLKLDIRKFYLKENLIISDKGQITLPAAMRKSLGLGRRSILTAEQIGGKIVLTPAVVLETEHYTEEQIAEWDRADRFGKDERRRLESRLTKRRG